METFTWIVGLLLVAAVLVGVARRVGVPYPAFLALAGAAVALLSPEAPDIRIDPEVVLALFIAPILIDAGYDASLRDLRRNWVPVGALAVIVVGLTTVGVAWTVKQLFPAMPWAAAFALGAMVAPPDAASTTAVLNQLRAPHRLKQILEGESLLNDALSLIVYRLAVAATMAGASVSAWEVLPRFALVAVASGVFGWALSRVFTWCYSRFGREAPPSVMILLQFTTGFGVWILAEALHLSAVISVVVFAMTASHQPDRLGARVRVPTYAVWETAVFVLNAFAFLLIGLQIDAILERLDPGEGVLYAGAAAAILAAVIAIRMSWSLVFAAGGRLAHRPERGGEPPGFRNAAVIGWAGMRGILSLAAALALPDAFPYRDEIVFLAFCVVLGTLVVQGLTLAPLIRLLKLEDDGTIDREVRHARKAALKAAIASLDGREGGEAEALRQEFAATLEATRAADRSVRPVPPHAQLRREAVAAARQAISGLRSSRHIGDEAFHQVEEELDWAELSTRSEAPS